MTVTPTAVMLVDDHEVVCAGFKLLVDGCLDLRVVAEARTGEDAVRRLDDARPDVVVMEIDLPGVGGLAAIRRIHARARAARVLVLSAREDAMHARRALQAGALGYLTKRSAPEALTGAIRRVARGERFLDAEIARAVATRGSAASDPLDGLSEKEFDVFLVVAKGRSVVEIARAMFLSPRTVGTHLYNIKQKLGASNPARLTLMAVRAGVLMP